MRGYLGVALGFLLMIPLAHAEDVLPIPIAYCQHMGYVIGINAENKPECVFGDGSKCSPTEFYNKACGVDKIKPIPQRQEGESVYVEFEKCEDGLVPSIPAYLLEQPKCVKPNPIADFFQNIFGFLFK